MKHEILKAYKFRLYPTTEQEIMLANTFGCVLDLRDLMILAESFEIIVTEDSVIIS